MTKQSLELNNSTQSKQPNCGRKFKVLFFLSITIFVLSLIGQLYVTNQLAIKGKEMVVLEQERKVLAKEISELELEQSKYASLTYIENQALAQGFVENENYVLKISPIVATAALQNY